MDILVLGMYSRNDKHNHRLTLALQVSKLSRLSKGSGGVDPKGVGKAAMIKMGECSQASYQRS